jgi:hypothetical protein
MDPSDVLEDGTVSVSAATYAICRATQPSASAFATVQDGAETTVVVEESELGAVDASAIERGWKRLTFEMELPFELVGFLATVATALASVDVSVFVISSYSTDHIFVDTDDMAGAVSELERLGCRVEPGAGES